MKRLLDAVVRIGVGVVVRRTAAALVLSGAGVAAIVSDEGTRNTVYLDVAGIPTVCTGHVTAEKVGTKKTDKECEHLLQSDTKVAQDAVRRFVKAPVSQNQFDSLVSFTFNVGAGSLQRSTLLKKLNAGDCHGAAAEFPKWDMAGGKHVKGLHDRRVREATKFEEDCE